jgi:hypothetical protein
MGKETRSILVGILLYVLFRNAVGYIWDIGSLSIRYDVPMSAIRIEREPSSCDFLRAPVGDKACHYSKDVTVGFLGRDANGLRVVCSDAQGNGCESAGKDHPAIIVSWNKVEEP